MQTLKDDEPKKLSILISRDLHARAKRYALQQDITLTKLVTELLELHLNSSDPVLPDSKVS
jgi:predicted HicB family RNase H-like nuclease